MKWYILLVVLAGLLTAADTPRRPTPPRETARPQDILLSYEKQLWSAWKNRDVVSLRSLLADDYQEVSSDGRMTKNQVLTRILPHLEISDYTLSDVKVLVLAKDVGLVSYRVVARGIFQGEPLPEGSTYVVSTWVQRQGRWQSIFSQSTWQSDGENP